MKDLVRNPLAALFTKRARWPDPEASIGDFVKLIDSKRSCWKAKGPAREAFKILAKEIKPCLDKCVEPVLRSGWVTWSIYMIGKAPESAAPFVMFFSHDSQFRREIQEAVRKSGILDKYPGIKSGNAAVPPDMDQLEQLASDIEFQSGAGSDRSSDIRVSGRKVFSARERNDVSSTRFATFGGLVQRNGDLYVLTAGHLLEEPGLAYFPRAPNTVNEEWELDTDSDADLYVYNEGFTDAMSWASRTPEDFRSERDISLDDASSETSSMRYVSGALGQASSRLFGQISQTQAASRQAARDITTSEGAASAVVDHRSDHDTTVTSASVAVEGHLVVRSVDLDYALIGFKNSDLADLQASMNKQDHASLPQPTHVISTGPEDTELFVYTASGGRTTGFLDGTPSYTRLPGSESFQEVYTAHFDRALSQGDCGSWVVHAENSGLYGHIVAGCERTRTAYIMPACKVFEDAEARLSGELLLYHDLDLASTETVTGHEYPAASHICSGLLDEPESCQQQTGTNAILESLSLEIEDRERSTTIGSGFDMPRNGTAYLDTPDWPAPLSISKWLGQHRSVDNAATQDSRVVCDSPEDLSKSGSMDPIAILSLVTLAITSSASLYKTIDSFKSHKQGVRHLKREIGDLNIVLQALAKNIEETTENFEVLRLILEQCVQACADFEKEVQDSVRKLKRQFEDVEVWARLRFPKSDIDNFRELIGSYKATITIALAGSNLRTVKITKQLLEKYTEMTQDTTSDLEDQIIRLSQKLDVLQGESAVIFATDSSGRGDPELVTTRQTLNQRASLEQCLAVCRRLLDHVEVASRSIPQDTASVASTIDDDYAARQIDSLAPRLTADALQMCTHNISAAVQHLRDLQEMKETPAEPDARRIMQQLDSARQCLDIVGKARQRWVNVFEDINSGGESLQTVVSTIGDLIRAQGLKIGGRFVNIMGQMQDESLQKITDNLHTNLAERLPMKDVDITFEKRHEFGHIIQPTDL